MSFYFEPSVATFVSSNESGMKTDRNLQKQIEKALESNLSLKGTSVSVTVENGQATLAGCTDKYFKKGIAKKMAKEIQGIKNVVEDIAIVSEAIADADIKAQISEKFAKNFGIAHNSIQISVNEGNVHLEGTLKWKYQKELAEECILHVDGIRSIENNIFIPLTVESPIKEKDVFAAIYGDPSVKSDIRIEIVGSRIILKGNVASTDEKNLVTRLVRNVPGVTEVENFLSANHIS
ncbi:MAG: BON domain-containing protein [Flavobacterium sp.]|nr:MAG: BON domain-containing protein [Flavobacterium sp.]